MLVLHQALLLTRQCIVFLIPDTPDFITQEIARTRLQQAHLHTRQRLLKHAQALQTTSLYQEDVHSSTDLPIASAQSKAQSSEGLYDALRSTAGSAFHMPLQLAGTLRSTVLNATNSLTNNTHPTSNSTRQTDDDMRASTVTIPTITAASPVISPREYHLSRLLQQHTTSPHTFNPFSITLLTLLPAVLHQLNISLWTYVPLAVLYFSYLQVAKDRNDKKLAIGIISDPNLIKFGKIIDAFTLPWAVYFYVDMSWCGKLRLVQIRNYVIFLHQSLTIYISYTYFLFNVVLSEMPSWVSDSQYQRVEWLNSLLGESICP